MLVRLLPDGHTSNSPQIKALGRGRAALLIAGIVAVAVVLAVALFVRRGGSASAPSSSAPIAASHVATSAPLALSEPGPDPVSRAAPEAAPETNPPVQRNMPEALEEKYKGADVNALFVANVELEKQMQDLCKAVLDEMFSKGQYRDADPPPAPGEDPKWDAPLTAKQFRSMANSDGTPRNIVAELQQDQHPQTRGLYQELAWVKEQVVRRGGARLLR